MSAASLPSDLGRLTLGGARVANWPNLITIVRTLGAVVVGVVSLVTHSWVLLLIAYLTYWLGDIADGRVARALNQETRLGAVFDILADRASCTICVASLLMIRPEYAPALTVYYIQFVVVDCLLSLGFLHWPEVLSPNYFDLVDRPIYLMNWSQPAKAANTGLLLTLLLVLPLISAPLVIATVVAVAQLAVKLWSGWRMLRLTTRE
ncbi:MAG: CDP-alcohol phosphatidyltransferase family protein [Propionibacteriaceae bacterium]|nr:CDP-alcohol phosphatidyltransferase family protein [Propionibacteriaceae bacterium]